MLPARSGTFQTLHEAEEKLREEAPWLLALSLPPTVFATMQSVNFTRQSDELMARKKVMAHTSVAVKLCLMQSKSGRKRMIEQPVGARAWGTQLMNELLFVKGVGKVNFDFCMFAMKSAKEREVRLARKRTSIISNSQALLKELTKYQASGRHQHVTTREWKTPTRHGAGVEDHGTPDVQRRVLQNRVRDHHEGEEQFGQHIRSSGQTLAGTQRGQGHHRNDRSS